MPSLRRVILLCLFLAVSTADEFGQTYNGTTSPDGSLSIYKYNVTEDQVMRVWLRCPAAGQKTPLLAVIRGRVSVLSLQIPFLIQPAFLYYTVARNLCPFADVPGFADAKMGNVSVELSSASPVALNFFLNATLVDVDIALHEKRELHASPSEPYFVRFRMPDGVDSVMVEVESSDDLCLVVSIQPIGCPVFDLDTNVKFIGSYQTMSKRAAMPITRDQHSEFYVVFVVSPADKECTDMQPLFDPNNRVHFNRVKTFHLVISSTISELEYILPIGITLAGILGLYLLAWVSVVALDAHDAPTSEIEQPLMQDAQENNTDDSAEDHAATSYGSTEERPSVELDTENELEEVEASPVRNGDLSPVVRSAESPTPEDYDTLDDAAMEKQVVRSRVKLTVSDLARKSWRQRDKKNRAYIWNLVTLSLFYTLPVVQLVFIWQMSVTTSGNQDLCYYNFLCARPLFGIYAFNNVFSNIGYVLLGLLFLMLVYHRERRLRKAFPHNEETDEPPKLGVPRHYGIFYAIGIALMMEGVMSACYHVCPSTQNYQFDTAFMYMLAALGLLKIYQMRHPDINPNSHVTYALMAAVILLAMIGVFVNEAAFWSVFAVFFILLLLALSLEFYYKGQWHVDSGVLYRVRHEWHSSTWRNWFWPTYVDRMMFLLIGNLINIALLVLGLIKRPNFPTFLLVLFITNLLIYVMYYIAMKLRYRERLRLRAVICMLLSLVTWAGSLVFFEIKTNSWTMTPAKSREQNQECIVLNFYDYHDVWHFLSSVSLFLSFLIILNIDDDLHDTHQTKIPVF